MNGRVKKAYIPTPFGENINWDEMTNIKSQRINKMKFQEVKEEIHRIDNIQVISILIMIFRFQQKNIKNL